MKILFQGDSITDAGRDRSDFHNLGSGYPFYAAKYIKERHPETDFEFINLGISGDQTKDLVQRLQKDFIDIDPDIISIHIGVNDTWHYAAAREWLSNDRFEDNYRTVLKAIKEKTHAKIIMIEQFLLPADDKDYFREDLNGKIDIERKLAREFADVYVPLDGLFAKALLEKPSLYWSSDGVHPNDNGSKFIGKIYADAYDEVIKK
ncbi:MAG: GDSL family lipase [Clostridia bacterium]|nr:GDSL family lipase [Clostridia bacterium]